MKSKIYLAILVLLLTIKLDINAQIFEPGTQFVNNIYRHLSYLGSDLFEGRGTGTMGGALSAKYLALEFNKLHLKPMGDDNTYYQNIPMHGSIALSSSVITITSGDSTIYLSLNEDFLLFSSGEQSYIPTPLKMVFVGYGIVAPEYDYDNYQSIDVAGKIVVMLEGEPASEDTEYFAGNSLTLYSSPEVKQRIAISRGARGSIIIPINHLDESQYWLNQKRAFSFEEVNLSYEPAKNLDILLNPQNANKLFVGAKHTFDEVLDLTGLHKTENFELEATISFTGYFKQRDFLASNIIGMIEGSDIELKDSYIIISAHYDHLGIGQAIEGDSIYNGVFDNAAGVAAMLELARRFTITPDLPKRSIIFMAVTGEENGLLGSTYYTDHPTVPLHKTIANINIDGVASFDNFKSVIGLGSEYSSLYDYLQKSADKYKLKIVPVPPEFQNSESFSRSDQISFAKAGIPSMLVLDAPDYVNISPDDALKMHLYYSSQIYHTPFDDLSLPINYSAVNQHVFLLFDIVNELANNSIEPEWFEGSFYSYARLRSKAEKR